MPRKTNTRSQTKNQSNNIPVSEDEIGDPSGDFCLQLL